MSAMPRATCSAQPSSPGVGKAAGSSYHTALSLPWLQFPLLRLVGLGEAKRPAAGAGRVTTAGRRCRDCGFLLDSGAHLRRRERRNHGCYPVGGNGPDAGPLEVSSLHAPLRLLLAGFGLRRLLQVPCVNGAPGPFIQTGHRPGDKTAQVVDGRSDQQQHPHCPACQPHSRLQWAANHTIALIAGQQEPR